MTCLHHPCQQLWLCHRQFRHVSFCDQCCKSQHMQKKCKTCDIKFRPLWNWSIKCRTCRGIYTKTYQNRSDSKRAFKSKEIVQKQCKFCIQPEIGKRICQICSEQLCSAVFFCRKTFDICLFRSASRKSIFLLQADFHRC